MSDTAALVKRVQDRRDLPPPHERRALRQRAGLALADIAAAAGVSKQAVLRWESGVDPSAANLGRYAEILRTIRAELDG